MAGLFDPSMFQNAMGVNDPRMGLLARLAPMLSQPTGMGGMPPMLAGMPSQPGTGAMAADMPLQRQGLVPPQPAPPMSPQPQAPQGGGGFLDALQGFLGNHSNALMGLGAGIASGGLQRGVPGMAAGGQMDYQRNIQQSSLASTYEALLKILPEPVARAAALNPEVLKAVAPSLYARSTLTDFGTDPLTGQKNMQWTNPLTQSVTPAVPGGQGGASTTSSQLFDQIEAARQGGASQDDLLQMMPPSLRSGVGAMISGRDIPANLSMRGAARDLTVRLAHAIDPTFDETMIPGRIKFAQGMAETTPGSNGGQKILLNTALQHAAEASDRLVELDNISGGVAPVGHAINYLGNQLPGAAGTKTALSDIAAKLSGEVGKLYSGSSGGGEAERQATAGRFSAENLPTESIGALQATKSLILDKLNSLQNQRDQVYGSKGERIYPLVDPQTQAALAKIDANIAKLQGNAPAGQSSAAGTATNAPAIGGAIPEGATATNQQTGQKIVRKGGQWVPVQ
jgi:hypothetical protein